ncbi:hypothetical protein WR25_09372 isoform A [Diploscapter pachys]|uniref:CRAL-TRIO domain-containing protein n=1 Tax=Diploscapter pachys TaxID=2018661 RepID=A0A2A2KWG7_9BILA|nr:hypothetical protein WR25_09372 isoform A [Diploscapter pachys]
MTVANARRADDPPSENEKELIEELRLRLKDKLPGGIPEDLDTDLNLNRWIRGYNGNIDDRIVQNFSEYVASRKAADFIGKDFVDKFFEMENIAPFLPFIASSRLQDRQFSEELNAFLFVERAWSQPKEFIKVFKTSDYLLHCFGYSEVLLQLILNREKKQDPSKGPVQFIVLFDLQTVNIMDYVTPSGYLKLWQLRSALWQDWFPEMCSAIYLLHPPRIISLVWSIAKLFLSEENLKRIVICHSEKELLKHLPKWFVPKEYGGDFVNQIPPGDESGVSIRRKITSADYYKPHLHYKKYGIERPKPSKKVGFEMFSHKLTFFRISDLERNLSYLCMPEMIRICYFGILLYLGKSNFAFIKRKTNPNYSTRNYDLLRIN